jgi:quinohemoprotein ethanol dehydrogenase
MSPMMIADLEVDGEMRHVLMQPNKNGMFYMLDAATGELLRGYAFTEVNWNTGIDMTTGRPIEVPEARYDATNMFNLAPGVQGGHGWHSNSYNPETGYIYIATQQAYFVMQSDENFVPQGGDGNNLAINMGANAAFARENPGAPSGFVGYVSAWDPAAQREAWRSEENPGPTGGVMSTGGGLVFSGGGNNTNEFRAYDTRTGEKLWSFDTQTGMVASPITFEMDGKQYVAASVGINQAGNYYAPNYSRLLVFTLGGDATLPQPLSFSPPQLNPPALTASAEQVATGGELYSTHCSLCHGNGGLSRGANFPNLLVSPMLNVQEGFDSVVLAGVRAQNGMVSFADRLSGDDTANIRAYLVSQAIEALAREQAAPVIESVDTGDIHTEDETAEN